MGRQAKTESILMGEGTYFDPRTSVPSIQHNYRFLFLQAVEKVAPQVLRNLRHQVWRHYDSIYRRAPLMPAHRWMYEFHYSFIWTWMEGKHPEGWTPRACRALSVLKRHLFRWARTYQIYTPWVLVEALNCMFCWTQFEPADPREAKKIDRKLNRLLGIDPSTLPPAEQQDTDTYSWNDSPKWFFPRDADRTFCYAGWGGEDQRNYEAKVRKEFDEHICQYLSEITARDLPKTPVLRRPERFEMLALYLCCNMTTERIAEAGFRKDPTAIYRDIRDAARLVGLELRKPGRASR